MAKASLRKNWRLVEAAGGGLSDEEIDREIKQVVLSANAERPNETGCPRHQHHHIRWDQTGSAPAKLVMDWVLGEGQIQVVTSPWVVSEYREVVRRTKFHRYDFLPIVGILIEESLRLPDPPTWGKRGPDPKDMPFPRSGPCGWSLARDWESQAFSRDD